jgi:hypothetical protein
MRSVSDSHNYRKHEEVARDLERRFGHDRVQGAHHERDGVERPDRTPSRAELRQEERTGITGKQVKEEVTALFRYSDGPEAFKAALEEKGYTLAKGDRRDFVIIDQAGGVHSLARRIDGVKAAELRAFMAPLDRDQFPDVETVKRAIAEREDVSLEKAYGRGDDYVSQTSAALKEHRRRQERLDKATPSPNNPGQSSYQAADPDASHDRRSSAQNAKSGHVEDGKQSDTRSASNRGFENVQMTDAMRERLNQFLEHKAELRRGTARDGPDRHSEAPGGGRSRSR